MSSSNKVLVLASKSKRRIELLENLGVAFIVIEPTGVVEVLSRTPEETVLENARRKAFSVFSKAPMNAVIISADTVIALNTGEIIGKPHTIKEQLRVLRRLSGRWHRVLTGVYIVDKSDNSVDYFVEETYVKMRDLSEKEIELYIASLEGLDKAGGYAIQGLGSLLIEEIKGDYYNVVGLPLTKLYIYLLKHGINILEQGVVRESVGRTYRHLYSSPL